MKFTPLSTMRATLDELRTCRLTKKERKRLHRIEINFDRINQYISKNVYEPMMPVVMKIKRYVEVWTQEATTSTVYGHICSLERSLGELEGEIQCELGKSLFHRVASKVKNALLFLL